MLRLLFLTILVFASIPAARQGQLVQDFAGIIPQQMALELESSLTKLKVDTTAEVVVAVVNSLDGDDIDSYANAMFNSWGLGDRERNNGVLFLIAPNERRTRIEVGYGLEPLLTDGLCGEILDDYVLPYFKKADMPGGIASGTNEVIRVLRSYPEAARGAAGSAPQYVASPRKEALFLNYILAAAALVVFVFAYISRRREMYGSTVFVIVCLIILGLCAYSSYSTLSLASPIRPWFSYFGGMSTTVLAFLFNLRQFRRYGPSRCKHCGSPLTLLSESKDDANLSEIQQLEEKIGAVDYDVWLCNACLKTDVQKYKQFFSGFNACPQCQNQTFKETTTKVYAATRMNSGLERINGECVSCKHKTSRTRVIPRISTSTSSSGGSRSGGGGFGGGSSGGGGSSRGW
jgi:uncharacterized protein